MLLEIKKQTGHKRGIIVTLINCATIAAEQDNFKKSLEWYREAESLLVEGGLDNYQNSIELGIADILLKQGKVVIARNMAKKVYLSTIKGGDLKDLQSATKILSEANQILGNYRPALEYRLEYEKFKDSIDNNQDQLKVMQLGFQYEYEKKNFVDSLEFVKKEAIKDLEIEKRDANLSKQRIAISAIGSGLILLILLAYSVQKGKKQSDKLLRNILPEEVAKELKAKGNAKSKRIDQVTVLFTDFKGFTSMSEKLTPKELVNDLNICFSAFDELTTKYGIEKIKTIGDAYMAAGGLPTPNNTHATDIIKAALEMRDYIERGKSKKIELGLPYFEVRIGIHTGPVVAGIVGVKKFQYDIWGDTVNTASRMESSGEVGKVNISQATYELVKNNSEFSFTDRGMIEAKGKGEVKMYFVDSKPNYSSIN